jgi:hypothetical protein
MGQPALSTGVLLAVALSALSSPGLAQTVYLCEGEGRSFAVTGAGEAPPGCRAIIDAVRELSLAPAQPDLEALSRAVDSLAARVAYLETLLVRPARRSSPLAPSPRQLDPSDSRDRMRDLGQDIERRLDDLGR